MRNLSVVVMCGLLCGFVAACMPVESDTAPKAGGNIVASADGRAVMNCPGGVCPLPKTASAKVNASEPKLTTLREDATDATMQWKTTLTTDSEVAWDMLVTFKVWSKTNGVETKLYEDVKTVVLRPRKPADVIGEFKLPLSSAKNIDKFEVTVGPR